MSTLQDLVRVDWTQPFMCKLNFDHKMNTKYIQYQRVKYCQLIPINMIIRMVIEFTIHRETFMSNKICVFIKMKNQLNELMYIIESKIN